jgi:hypothetical protein
MDVLESPITWIVVAAVLVVLAIVLLVISSARRRRARRAAAAAAWPPPALEASRMNPDAPWTGPTPTADAEEERVRVGPRTPVSNVSGRTESAAAARYTEPDTAPLDVDTIRARLAAELAKDTPDETPQQTTPEDATPVVGDTTDEEPQPEEPQPVEPRPEEPQPAPHRPRHAAAHPGAPDTEATDGTDDTDTGPATESVKDRLLGVLLRDPQAAIAALGAASGGDERPGESDVTALLRAGLTPAQVARLVGVDEHDLATVVARRLGLLPGQTSGDVTTGENRTDDPGRSWANVASPAGSTTPTTG